MLSSTTKSFAISILLLLLSIFGHSSVGIVSAIECEVSWGKCLVPSCDTRDSPTEKNLYVPNGICENGIGYEDRERQKRSACIERYNDIFDPRIQDAIDDESLCTYAVDVLLETLDIFSPFTKLKWLVMGTKKATKALEYLENKIGGLSDVADKLLERMAKKLGQRAQRLYKKFKEELEMIEGYYEGIQDATLTEPGPNTKALKDFCESKIQSQNIGNLDDSVGWICEDLISITAGEIKKGAERGYKELYEVLIKNGDEDLKELVKLKNQFKKKPTEWLIENQPELENEIRLVSDFVDGVTNFKKTMRPNLVKKCQNDYTVILDGIIEVCSTICNPQTRINLGIECCEDYDEAEKCVCENYDKGKWCPSPDEPFAGRCVAIGEVCECDNKSKCCPETPKYCVYCDIFMKCTEWCCPEGERCYINGYTCGP